MKKLTVLCALILLAGCAPKAPFKFDRENACVINYGDTAFSVIVDKNRTFIRNNRVMTNSGFYLVTEDQSFHTMGKYFDEGDIREMVKALRKSPKVYIRWLEPAQSGGGSNAFRATVNTTGFSTVYDKCVENQQMYIK